MSDPDVPGAPPALQLWPFAQAPPAYQALSEAGGDEDWVLYCPAALLGARWPWELELALHPDTPGLPHRHALGSWGWAEMHGVSGGVVVIFAHG